ncbi:hypothetical protein PVIIG_05707 [Plasmodium vivax India VII]|uniref:Uncharacterized protein n=1 Tax=Plasmodium vivax India VII TaxID=1077284 RepID=A0A0J9S329_PLAVI|nr:hypothetical protein PVIIG_05707 [Plasmodium vivax India VII]
MQDINTKCPIKDETNCCKFLNYSINDIVKKDGKHSYNEENLIQAYGRLATRLEKCENSIKTIEKNVFNNVKKLLNIYYKFNKHINIINGNQTNDCQDLSHIVQSYQNIKSTCRGETKKFCDAVDKFKSDCLSKIKKIKCKHVDYNLKHFFTLDDSTIVEFEEEEEAQAQLKRDIKKVVEDEAEGSMGTEITAYLSNTEHVDGDNNGETSNHNASSPVRTITYTSLGLILPLATLYRVKKYLKNLIILYEY